MTKSDKPKKVGIVTFFRGNYGSILQCYATCSALEKLGFSPCVLEKEENRYANLSRFALRCLCHPRHIGTFWRIRQRSFGGGRLSAADRIALRNFEAQKLPVLRADAAQLKKLGHDEQFVSFLSGSDQIWGGHVYVIDAFWFLRFAPQGKRMAWAPSFGSADIASYNRKTYRKYMSQYQRLSVRENSAVRMVEELTGKTPAALTDPVFLLSREEWRTLDAPTPREDYVLCYFLDAPNENTLRQIEEYCAAHQAKPIVFGPWNEQYHAHAFEKIEGGPDAFVSLIDRAACVFTDSFHAMSFSLIMNTPFFVYKRNYAHGIDQSARIRALLERTEMLQYFEPQTMTANTWNFDVSNGVLQQDREKLLSYLRECTEGVEAEEVPSKDKARPISLRGEDTCTGCGACIAACARGAISKKRVGFGAWIPEIDRSRCVLCGLCTKVCPQGAERREEEKKAYIAYHTDREMRLRSASGGAFSALASYVLDRGGCVFGAEMRFENGQAVVEHVMITAKEELWRILGSKYVQSDTAKAYPQVKKALREGKTVLFSGCSCQIAGLKGYLGDADQHALYTVDLICHGTPGIDQLRAYIRYLEKKNGAPMTDLTFRTKAQDRIIYEITAHFAESGAALCHGGEIKIPIRESAYYRMFITGENYRLACYQCPYASLDKPADITVGDYFEAKTDYPALFVGEDAIDSCDGISCVLVHDTKGMELIKQAEAYLYTREVQPHVAQASHCNLQRPTSHSRARGLLQWLYRTCGYGAVETLYYIRNRMADLVKKILRR